MRKTSYTIGCYAIIFKGDSVLLIHRTDYDIWHMPGGGLEPNESLTECVVRETKEEIGLTVAVKRLTGIYQKPGKNDFVFMFLTEIIDGAPTPSKEAVDIKYFPINKLPPNLSDNMKVRIHDAISHAATPIIRVQTSTDLTALLAKLK